jgi:hypothetical protein
MKVFSRKIISRTTGEDLADSSPWLRKNKEYIVLALNYFEGTGLDIYIQTEDHNEPRFISANGFEFINQKFPSSWVTVFSESHGRKIMTVLPASWNYHSFFEDMENQDPKAIELFNKEVEQIYCEEGLLD